MKQVSAGSREPFSSLLTDFSDQLIANNAKHDASLDGEREEQVPEAPVEERFSFTKEELDQIRREAFAQGQQEGFDKAAVQSTQDLGVVISQVVSFLEDEASKGKKLLEEVSETFVESLNSVVCTLISTPEVCSAIQRSLSSDINDLISECEGKITITTSPLEESAIRGLVREQGDIEILSDQSLRKGQVLFMSGKNKISIDQESWVNQVQKKVRESVKTAASAS